MTLGYDWGPVRLESEFFQRVTGYGDQSDIDIFDDESGSSPSRSGP